jgi:hypothetical protein
MYHSKLNTFLRRQLNCAIFWNIFSVFPTHNISGHTGMYVHTYIDMHAKKICWTTFFSFPFQKIFLFPENRTHKTKSRGIEKQVFSEYLIILYWRIFLLCNWSSMLHRVHLNLDQGCQIFLGT